MEIQAWVELKKQIRGFMNNATQLLLLFCKCIQLKLDNRFKKKGVCKKPDNDIKIIKNTKKKKKLIAIVVKKNCWVLPFFLIIENHFNSNIEYTYVNFYEITKRK